VLWDGFSFNGLPEPDGGGVGLEILRQPMFRHADMAVVYVLKVASRGTDEARVCRE
jgi:hypothetical protein